MGFALEDVIAERDELRKQVAELTARLEHHEGLFVPGTKLLIPCRAIKPLDWTPPLLRCVETRHGAILNVLPGDVVLDER